MAITFETKPKTLLLTLLPRGWFYNFLRVTRKLLLNCHGEGRMFLLDRKLLVTIFVSLGSSVVMGNLS